ncbi:MAG TPA: Holliday junction branch migration protein RuvA [Planctomycetes bacterium]|nr:Holliday junction branch migration protein RuvA [Planctomycetota bacterium]
MYEYLIGRVAHRAATRLVLEVGGVGYDIVVPVGVDFRPDAEDRLRVFTHFVVREDSQQLFGFPDAGMREIFRLLLRVRGVGPNLAQGILSSLSESELLEAIAAEDTTPLTRIKGVGKKTAQQILLDLKDRAPAPTGADRSVLVPRSPGGGSEASVLSDAVGALLSIGYTEKQARASVDRAREKVGADDLETLVRAALRE